MSSPPHGRGVADTCNGREGFIKTMKPLPPLPEGRNRTGQCFLLIIADLYNFLKSGWYNFVSTNKNQQK